MKKGLLKDIATSSTTLVFLVIGTTGVLMYFHLFDTYTKQMHEILGLVFVGAALLHVLANFKQMKQYFSKKIFLSLSLVVSIVVIGFLLNSNEMSNNPKRAVFDKVFNSSIEKSFALFGDLDKVKEKLVKAGIKVDGAKSIQEISIINQTSPFKIIDIVSK